MICGAIHSGFKCQQSEIVLMEYAPAKNEEHNIKDKNVGICNLVRKFT